MRASGAAGARFIAIFVDFFIVALLYFPALLILPAILGTNLWQWNGLFGTVLNILLPSSLFWFYKAGLEMGWSTTVGKRLAGLRVVKGDLSKISSTQALVRNADILLWGVTFALVPLVSWMLVRTKGTSLGDLFAHTYVVPT